MPLRDKIEHAIQNQPCTVKDLKAKFGGDRGADRKVMEALDQLVHEAVICQKQGVFFTVRSGRAEKALLCKVVSLPTPVWRAVMRARSLPSSPRKMTWWARPAGWMAV